MQSEFVDRVDTMQSEFVDRVGTMQSEDFPPIMLTISILILPNWLFEKLLCSFTLFLCNKSNSKLLNFSLAEQNVCYTS
jgi:hypothetical protein